MDNKHITRKEIYGMFIALLIMSGAILWFAIFKTQDVPHFKETHEPALRADDVKRIVQTALVQVLPKVRDGKDGTNGHNGKSIKGEKGDRGEDGQTPIIRPNPDKQRIEWKLPSETYWHGVKYCELTNTCENRPPIAE